MKSLEIFKKKSAILVKKQKEFEIIKTKMSFIQKGCIKSNFTMRIKLINLEVLLIIYGCKTELRKFVNIAERTRNFSLKIASAKCVRLFGVMKERN